MNKKGFTLIELLAVIVILGVIMIIAIPSVTSYITNARKDSYISDAKMFLNATKTKLTADATLPQGTGEKIIVPIKDIELDKGGEKSPYGNDWNYDTSYVVVQNVGTSSDPEYVWSVALEDVKGNCIPLTSLNDLKREIVGTGCTIISTGETIPEGGVYYSGVTEFDDIKLEVVTATNIYTGGDVFPAIQVMDVYIYGDYMYMYAEENGVSGWAAFTLDKTKTKYDEILPTINGKNIVALPLTFMDCTNLVTAPIIPDTVIFLDDTFNNCTSLTTAPAIPEGVVRMDGTFSGCTSLTTAPKIPSKVTDMHQAFYGCELLTGEVEVDANPTRYDYAFWGTVNELTFTGLATDETKENLANTVYDQ